MDYIVTGLNMMDVNVVNGQQLPPAIGGITLYGYCGMRLFTDKIGFVARVGADFHEHYGKWFSANKISSKGLNVVSEKMPYLTQTYTDEGPIGTWEFFTGDWKDAVLWRPHADDILRNITQETKGFYTSCGDERDDLWNGIFQLKKQGYPFKIMWEPNGVNTVPENRESFLRLMEKIEMASFSLYEGLRIFGLSTEEELLDFLKDQPCELILLRVGARGLYTIHGGKAAFIPSVKLPDGMEVVDTTGCGNAATAGACYAWCEGYDMIMTGIMANIASSYNLRQVGPYPVFTDKDMADAAALAQKLYDDNCYILLED